MCHTPHQIDVGCCGGATRGRRKTTVAQSLQHAKQRLAVLDHPCRRRVDWQRAEGPGKSGVPEIVHRNDGGKRVRVQSIGQTHAPQRKCLAAGEER